MILEGEIKDAKFGSFSSDFLSLMKHWFHAGHDNKMACII